MHNMKTLKDIALARKARKGPAEAVTKDGAYWLPVSVNINVAGGDGIGQSDASRNTYLNIRHYRSGELGGYIEQTTWHQNTGSSTLRTSCSAALGVTNHEDLLIVLRKAEFDTDHDMNIEVEVSDRGIARLLKEIPELPAAPKAPDEQ